MGSTPRSQTPDRRDQFGLGRLVDGREHVVEQQQLGLAIERASQRGPLPLATREHHPTLTDDRIEALRQCGEIGAEAGRLDDHVELRIRPARDHAHRAGAGLIAMSTTPEQPGGRGLLSILAEQVPGPLAGEANVVADAGREQEGRLRDHGDALAQRGELERARVVTIDRDRPGRRRVNPGE
jgi:hypothetical protein